MSNFRDTVVAAISAARARGISLKLSSLRDAISYALVGMPYNKAMFTEREGRLPAFSATMPARLAEAAARYSLSPTLFAPVFLDLGTLTAAELSVSTRLVVCSLSTSSKHYVDGNGEIAESNEHRPAKPLFRLVVTDPSGDGSFAYWWASKPRAKDVVPIIGLALNGRLNGVAALTVPAISDELVPGLSEALAQAFGLVIRRPSGKTQMARSAVLASDKVLMWLLSGLERLGEGSTTLNELYSAAESLPIAVPAKSDDHERMMGQLYAGYNIADAICRSRGRDPEQQRARRERLPIGAPQAVLGVPPPDSALNAVDVAINLLETSERHYMLYGDHGLEIAHLMKAWEKADAYSRPALEAAIGSLMVDAAVQYGEGFRGRPERVFGWQHPYSSLLMTWCSRVLAGGYRLDDGSTVIGMGLRLTFDNEGPGLWPKRVPLQEELRNLLRSQGWGSAEFEDYISNWSARDEAFNHSGLRKLLSDVLDRQGRWETTQSGKARYMSMSDSPRRIYGAQRILLINPEISRVPFPDLTPWVNQVNNAFVNWKAGCRLSSARLESPLDWPVESLAPPPIETTDS